MKATDQFGRLSKLLSESKAAKLYIGPYGNLATTNCRCAS